MSKTVSSIAPVDRLNMTEGERKSRVECAAGHHLLELYNLTDMVQGVLGVRVEDELDAYLLKTYRAFFDEVCASDLVKVRCDEEPDQGPGRPLNYSSVGPSRRRIETAARRQLYAAHAHSGRHRGGLTGMRAAARNPARADCLERDRLCGL